MVSSVEIVAICPSESELSEVLTNLNCPEPGCTSMFPNTSTLQMHLIKTHSKQSDFLSKRAGNQTYRYFCPIKGCKYENNKERSEEQLRWFNKKKHLKQHYQQVHKERKFKCSSCEKSFINEAALKFHCSSECGVKFSCLSCCAMYNSQVALETHCRRKNHLKLLPVKKMKNVKQQLKNTKNNDQIKLISSLKRPILPKPVNNPIENIAAAALSELSWKIVVRGVDKEVQTVSRRRTPIRSLKKKDTQETQTGEKKPKISQETQTTGAYKNRSQGTKLGIQTQTFHDLFPELSQSPQNPLDDVILPQFYTSSTQTPEETLFDIKKDLELDIFNDQQSLRSYSDQIARIIENSIGESKYCNNETQTEIDFVQNAIDEYSHNYTQTCEDIFLNDFVEFSDIETQTGWANLNVESGLISAETQTCVSTKIS